MTRQAIESLQNGTSYPWIIDAEPNHPKKPKVQGAYPLFHYLESRFSTDRVNQPITWYFSLGESADLKWTLCVDDHEVQFYRGRPKQKQADCVLKTDMKMFERMVKEGYIPSFTEFAEGKVKTNNPQHLRSFQSIFAL
jgi:hypothetical protein